MNLGAGVSVGQLLVAILVVAGGSCITWGGLLQRVKQLEREVLALAGVSERLTRIEEQTGFIKSEVSKITTSWLFRAPPEYGPEDYNPVRPTRHRP